MKKILFFAGLVTMFSACTKDATRDLAVIPPDAITVAFENNSRIQLDANCKTVWNADDKVSVFYKSDANDCWRFCGNTGDKSGILLRESQGSATVANDKIVIAYPYNSDYVISTADHTITAYIPKEQNYLNGSYDAAANIMVSSGTENTFILKNTCGWLRLQFKGTDAISKIKLKGNAGEQIAGKVIIDYETLDMKLIKGNPEIGDNTQVDGTIIFEDEYISEITLNCTKSNVELNPDTATYFYIALAPQTFAKGISVTAYMNNGTVIEKSTDNTITVERNHIVPMSAIAIPNSQIWYTSTDREIVKPQTADGFGATILSNSYAKGKGIIFFDGKITSIGNEAFSYCSRLTSITIPDSVTSIGSFAFDSCSNLTSITIPDSVTSIGSAAFRYCSNLTSITIPDSVTSIGSAAFYGCSSITSITIGNSVTSIRGSAFYGCSSLATFYGRYSSSDSRCLIMDGKLIAFASSGLTEYIIPNGVTSIGDNAFRGCSSLTSITIPDSVTAIGDSAFEDCSSLTSITMPDSVTSIGNEAFSGCSSLTSISIPDGITSIGKSVFRGCSSLTSITIPDSVISIGDWAFADCSSLKSITIPDSVTSIGDYAFKNCHSLATFYGRYSSSDSRCLIMGGKLIAFAPSGLTEYVIPDSVTSIGDYAFYDCDRLTNITIPDGVSSIGDSAFEGCNSLTSINIPNNVTSIGNSAFADCSSLTSITIPNRITMIGDHTFRGCSSLTNISIPNNVTSIGYAAFYGCINLASVTIPYRVTIIDYNAFGCCSNLTSIYCDAWTPPTISNYTFHDVSSCTLYVPRGCKEAYSADKNWSRFTKIVEF